MPAAFARVKTADEFEVLKLGPFATAVPAGRPLRWQPLLPQSARKLASVACALKLADNKANKKNNMLQINWRLCHAGLNQFATSSRECAGGRTVRPRQNGTVTPPDLIHIYCWFGIFGHLATDAAHG
jgi:hypothetical protein